MKKNGDFAANCCLIIGGVLNVGSREIGHSSIGNNVASAGEEFGVRSSKEIG